MEEESKRGRGRPEGSTNKAPRFEHYNPRKWEPWMDSLVLHKIKGLSNSELAERFEISVTHVSNILSTRQAKEVIEKVRKEVLDKSTDVADRLVNINDKIVQRMEEFITDDDLFYSKKLASTGKALEMFRLTSGIKDEKVTNVTNNTSIQNNIIQTNNAKFLDRLATGLEKSNSMRELHSVKDAEFEIIEKEKVG